MKLKDKIKEEPGFQYVVDSLELMSSVGQRRLLEQEWLTTPEQIAAEHDRLAAALQLLDTPAFTTIRHQLMQLHDITNTLRSLHSHILLNEVELLEIKRFCQLYSTAINALVGGQAYQPVHEAQPSSDRERPWWGVDRLESLSSIFVLLDPDKTGMAHFYIYDSYDERLAPLRKALKANPEDAEFFAQMQDIEREVLSRLSDALVPYAPALQQALDEMAYLDLLLAKAVQVRQWGLTRPQLGGQAFQPVHEAQPSSERERVDRLESLSSMWNPRLKARCEEQGLRYQPVDISLTPGVTLITGANMAGKTVLLKTVGIAQMMLQFGMYVPASQANMTLVNDVLFCIGDEQNEMNGLSSFASEILKISDALSRAESQRLLILIDEPARTTNPIEGKAIVQSLSTLLNAKDSITLVTTHYSQLALPCRRLRVKGFDETLSPLPLTPQNINHFMDYSLLPDSTDEAPQEALRIASILGCHPALIAEAVNHLQE